MMQDITLNEALKASKKIAEDYQHKYTETLSDFDNYKKRKEVEFVNAKNIAIKEFVVKLLPFLDDFEVVKNSTEDYGTLLIYRKLMTILLQNNITSFCKVGDVFDADLHDAILFRPSETLRFRRDAIVSKVVKKGYKIGNEIIRHAQVCVEQ